MHTIIETVLLFVWSILGAFCFAILAIGLIERRALRTRRDPQFECTTTRQYVRMKEQSKRHLIGGAIASFVIIGIATLVDPTWGGTEFLMLVALCSYLLIAQYQRIRKAPKFTERPLDEYIHLIGTQEEE